MSDGSRHRLSCVYSFVEHFEAPLSTNGKMSFEIVLVLKDYQGTPSPIIGRGYFSVQYKQFAGRLPLVVVEKPLTSLLGLNWFASLGLTIGGINSITDDFDNDVLA